MNKTLIAGAIFALVSTATSAAPPSGNTNKDAEQDARLNAIESSLANIESELASQGAAIEALQTGGAPGGTVLYRYVGNTSKFLSHGSNQSEWVSVFDLNAACREEFGADAKFAKSKEVAAAIDDGTFMAPASSVFIWASDVHAMAIYQSSNWAYDPHLNAFVDPNFGMLFASTRSFGPVSSSGPTTGQAACSAPQ